MMTTLRLVQDRNRPTGWLLGCFLLTVLWLIAFGSGAVLAQETDVNKDTPLDLVLASPSDLMAQDHPGDKGNAIDLRWQLSPDDLPRYKPRRVRGYLLTRTLVSEPLESEEVEHRFQIPYGVAEFTDRLCRPGASYRYQIAAQNGDVLSSAVTMSGDVQAVKQWFDSNRAGFAFILVLICGGVLYFTERAKSGKSLFVREVAALKAMSEAVGRATEMGRPCLFVPGIEDMNEIGTVAGVSILSHVAEIAADYQADLLVPTTRSLVMTAAQEAVAGAYLAVDRADYFDPSKIYYVSDEQFAYVAHVTGYMVREKPAACFYAGVFYGESLIFAETGNSIGAIQIAGTSESTQIPFFVAGCDYTLLGEELFAASAYLTREPQQLGSLKGQDAGKVLAAILLLVGCILSTLLVLFPGEGVIKICHSFLIRSLLGGG